MPRKGGTMSLILTMLPRIMVPRKGGTMSLILPTITKDNNIFELQGLLEHNDFTNELATIKQMLNMYQIKIMNIKTFKSKGEKKIVKDEKIHLVFTRIFNFLESMFKFKHALFHSYLPFPNF
jgi:hypothetical protein